MFFFSFFMLACFFFCFLCMWWVLLFLFIKLYLSIECSDNSSSENSNVVIQNCGLIIHSPGFYTYY